MMEFVKEERFSEKKLFWRVNLFFSPPGSPQFATASTPRKINIELNMNCIVL